MHEAEDVTDISTHDGHVQAIDPLEFLKLSIRIAFEERSQMIEPSVPQTEPIPNEQRFFERSFTTEPEQHHLLLDRLVIPPFGVHEEIIELVDRQIQIAVAALACNKPFLSSPLRVDSDFERALLDVPQAL